MPLLTMPKIQVLIATSYSFDPTQYGQPSEEVQAKKENLLRS